MALYIDGTGYALQFLGSHFDSSCYAIHNDDVFYGE